MQRDEVKFVAQLAHHANNSTLMERLTVQIFVLLSEPPHPRKPSSFRALPSHRVFRRVKNVAQSFKRDFHVEPDRPVRDVKNI